MRTAALTKREFEVLWNLALGYTERLGAERLGISHHTWRAHVHSIHTRLHVHTNAEAVAIGFERGWLRQPHQQEARKPKPVVVKPRTTDEQLRQQTGREPREGWQ